MRGQAMLKQYHYQPGKCRCLSSIQAFALESILANDHFISSDCLTDMRTRKTKGELRSAQAVYDMFRISTKKCGPGAQHEGACPVKLRAEGRSQ